MSELLNLFKKLSENKIETALKSYVYYNSATGKVYKVSNRKISDSEYSILEVSFNDTEDLLSGKKRTDDYIVVPSETTSLPVLKLLNSLILTSDVEHRCYKLPVKLGHSNVNIIKNLKTQSWDLQLDAQTALICSAENSKNTLYFSITKKDDPNILYRSIEFFNNTTSIPFAYDFEYMDETVSIYSSKYFNTYSYEVIK